MFDAANLFFEGFLLYNSKGFCLRPPAQLIFVFQIPCADLHEVIDALVEKTAGTLQPFLLEEPYEENISRAQLTAQTYSQ